MSNGTMKKLMGAAGAATLAVLAVLVLAPAASAAVVVTTTTDGGAGSLREAVEEAAPNETVVLPTGTYKLTVGELAIKRNISIVGSGPDASVIEGSGAARVLKTTSPGEVTLENLAIRGGRVNSTIAQGAGILDSAGHLVLRNVAVVDNLADAKGPDQLGGIAEGAGLSTRLTMNARVTIVDSTFSGNVADASGGNGESGGLAEGGAINMFESGALEISGSTFVENKALSRGSGGGLADGGALYVTDNFEPGTITTSTIAENFVESGNAAHGGGIYIASGQKADEIDRVTITGNRVHSTKAIGSGGGIDGAGFEDEDLRVIGSTIVGNSADRGGNVQIGDSTQFSDTVVSGGIGAAGGENCGKGSEIVSLGFNLDSLDQCGFHAPGDLVDSDPQLGPLADNGGPTLTMLPAQTSPLVDAGAGFDLTTDQRGLPRPVDDPRIVNSTAAGADGAEIGAVELPAQPPAETPPPAPPAPQPPAPPGTTSETPTGSGTGTTIPMRMSGATFRLGRLTMNAKTGSATLTVAFSDPATGTLALSGTGLKARTRTLAGATSSRLVVATAGKAHAALVAKGSLKTHIVVTFTPAGAAPQRIRRAATLTLRSKT
jgi:hypothetical protein